MTRSELRKQRNQHKFLLEWVGIPLAVVTTIIGLIMFGVYMAHFAHWFWAVTS